MNYTLEIGFKTKAIKPEDVWIEVYHSFEKLFLAIESGSFLGKVISISDVEKTIVKKAKPYFDVRIADTHFIFAAIANNDLSFLSIKNYFKKITVSPTVIENLTKLYGFCQARFYCSEYERWQNASDPLEYESQGKSYSHLPMVSNNLPFPLEKKVIDISKNPGRRTLRKGYIEAIGPLMWLKTDFLISNGAELESLFTLDWIEVSEISENIILINAENCFANNEDPACIRSQHELRKLLFPLVENGTTP